MCTKELVSSTAVVHVTPLSPSCLHRYFHSVWWTQVRSYSDLSRMNLLVTTLLVPQTKLSRPQCCVHYAVYARITCSVCRCRLWQVVYTYCDASSVVTSKSVRDKSYNCYTESYTPQPIDLIPISQLLPYIQSFFSFEQHVIYQTK